MGDGFERGGGPDSRILIAAIDALDLPLALVSLSARTFLHRNPAFVRAVEGAASDPFIWLGIGPAGLDGPEDRVFLPLVPGRAVARCRRVSSDHVVVTLEEASPSPGMKTASEAPSPGDPELLRARLRSAMAGGGAGDVLLLFVHIDRLEAINETFGPAAGDRLLGRVATRLRNLVSEGGLAMRLDGATFAALLRAGRSEKSGADLAQRVAAEIGRPYAVSGELIEVPVRIGAALAFRDGPDPDRVIEAARMALSRAKENAPGTVRFFDEEIEQRIAVRRKVEADLRRAARTGDFDLVYQPQIDVRTRRVVGMEALMRRTHAELGPVPPAVFIPVAEATGLIIPIGDEVMRRACREAAGWPGDVRVAVNLSPVQFRRPGLVAFVADLLSETGLDPSRLEIEVTESALSDGVDDTLVILEAFRRLGIRIAMDDFGTGHSGLGRLRSFPFDKVKIDKSFVQAMNRDLQAMAVVRAVAGLGAVLGLRVTAEGVETEEQLARLAQEGCDEVQGFLLGRPMPPAEAAAFIAGAA